MRNVVFDSAAKIQDEIVDGLDAEAGGGIVFEENVGEVEDAGAHETKDGKTAGLNHFGANADNGLQGLAALAVEKLAGMFWEKVDLCFEGQAASKIPIEAAAEAWIVLAATAGRGLANCRKLHADFSARVDVLRTNGCGDEAEAQKN